MILYHATTEKKAKAYRANGHIKSPVRGFTTLQAAMAWAIKVGRKVVYKIEGPSEKCQLLHEDDLLYCQKCKYEITGKVFSAYIVKKNSLVLCPCCKGKGYVKK